MRQVGKSDQKATKRPVGRGLRPSRQMNQPQPEQQTGQPQISQITRISGAGQADSSQGSGTTEVMEVSEGH